MVCSYALSYNQQENGGFIINLNGDEKIFVQEPSVSIMERKDLCLLIIVVVLSSTDAMTRQQIKNSGKLLKKNCMGKNSVTEDQIGNIEQGAFIEDKNVMCYIACIYQMSNVVKNNKLSYEASIKQVDMLYPPDLKDAAKASITNCKNAGNKYKDLCEAAYWVAKCMYEDNPKTFIFP